MLEINLKKNKRVLECTCVFDYTILLILYINDFKITLTFINIRSWQVKTDRVSYLFKTKKKDSLI